MTARHTPPAPNYDDPKELYAFFGLAFYKANVLEHGVMNLAVALLAQGNLGITVAEVAARFCTVPLERRVRLCFRRAKLSPQQRFYRVEIQGKSIFLSLHL